MRAKIIKIFWGIILVSLIGLTLACRLGYVTFDNFAGPISLFIFGSLSAAFFVCYFVSGVRNWGWLFPALFSASLALNAARVFEHYGSPIVAFPFLLSIAIPFYIGYTLNRNQWEWLVPAGYLTIIAVVPPFSERSIPMC